MKKFLTRLIAFSTILVLFFIMILSGYIYYDPFKVLYAYNDYSYLYVIPNRDYITTEMFMKNKDKYNYNSFIFGNSRTLAFKPDSWQKHLDKNSKIFVFDATGESIYGIFTKIRYLDSINIKMDNVLVVFCRDDTFSRSENHKGHLFIKHPLTSGESNAAFHLEFFKAYIDKYFLISFYDYLYTKEYKPYMKNYIETRKIAYDTITNSISIIDQENELKEDQNLYYAKHKDIFYNRTGEKIDSVQRINDRQLFMLKEIKRIFEKNCTHYKIVLSPLYEQIKFSKYDKDILNGLFGNNLYDFSGSNGFTNSITNYYETSHYKPNVGDSILSYIYNK